MRDSPQSPTSPAFLDTPEVRRRVVRACQRCRVKKCKCDGATPCTRCKSDDTICMYGQHKKLDKTVYRSGYVQMLERQHMQLTAGLQELYRRTQNGGEWTGPHLEFGNHNQPLTHKILETLGVLHPDDWEDMECVNHEWGNFGKQGQDENDSTYSGTGLPVMQAAFSQSSPIWTAFPKSEIMSKRRSKVQTSLVPTVQRASMPPPLMTSAACIKPEHNSHAVVTQSPPYTNAFPSSERMHTGLDQVSDSIIDRSFGIDDLFSNLGGQEQLAEGY